MELVGEAVGEAQNGGHEEGIGPRAEGPEEEEPQEGVLRQVEGEVLRVGLLEPQRDLGVLEGGEGEYQPGVGQDGEPG